MDKPDRGGYESRVLDARVADLREARDGLMAQGFTAVVLLACYENDAGQTQVVEIGGGNHFARDGLVASAHAMRQANA